MERVHQKLDEQTLEIVSSQEGVLKLRKSFQVPFHKYMNTMTLRKEDIPNLLLAIKEKWGEGILSPQNEPVQAPSLHSGSTISNEEGK